MSTLNLEADINTQLAAMDEKKWSPLQTRITMAIATAKLDEFRIQAHWAGELIQLGVLERSEAADILHEAAVYNGLSYEYGGDRIQQIMSTAFSEAVA